MSLTTQLLSSSGYIMYNKNLAKTLGVNEAVLLGEFCAKYEYWLQKGDLFSNNGWFFVTRDDIQDDTGLSDNQQRSAIQTLKDNGVVEAQKKGIPAKMWYKLNVSRLDDLMSKKWTTGGLKSGQQDIGKVDDITKKDTKKEKEDITPISPKEKTDGIFEEYAKEDRELMETLIAFEKMRKQIESPMTEKAKTVLVSKLDSLSGKVRDKRRYKLDALNDAILNNWKSVYELKEFKDKERDAVEPVKLTEAMDTMRIDPDKILSIDDLF